MNIDHGLIALALVLALGACSPGEAASADSSREEPAVAPDARAAVQPDSSFPPWKKEADCYWVLTYPDGVAHRAWIAAAQKGVFLNIVDESMESWPVSDTLPIVLVADGAGGQSVATRGSHGDGDGSTLLTVILDEPQRALIAGAKRVELTSESRPGFTLPLHGAPSESDLEACDTNPGPADFSEDD